MSSRRAPNSDSKPENRLEKAGALVRQRALTGTEASTIGFLLVGYVGAFALAGYGLDVYFKTSWIVAVGVLVGAVVGFREMFRMAQKLGRESIQSDAEKSREQLARGAQFETQSQLKKSQSEKSAVGDAASNDEPQKIDGAQKPRYFSIPPPPTASFEKSDKQESAGSQESDDSLP